MKYPTREEKIKKIYKKIWWIYIWTDNLNRMMFKCMIWDILLFTFSAWYNMVVGNVWKIMFNKAWTAAAEWSYRESQREKLESPIEEQSDECIDFIFSLIQ